ncbi:fumarate reductase/succinate dehydrogenase flavoprotein domain protein [Leptothrix cholodnii SP-6]|uniref:Fumarate reductase/succinate dehydrogenase flavoprotein domain protein n=1 Tax=Leptothrix cholodnii (strain ATCC 51168 / LMG 8142 / SP-6) TaxID=395495 RepID=B1Y5I0_LEPCP|nr:FAD-dependent oxidoreductase [Leptothrix cholodnii]ACB34692.1 fumarate reductase/succinate dehydrogenase flavoprotein domain protein [Leptothrix cholodnii SP-6]
MNPLPDDPASLPAECDLLVIGSGAGGLSAAVTAAWFGLDVVVVEKEPVLGGTTAWSGGWMWVPRNPLARAAGMAEDLAPVRAYLRHILGAQYDAARIEALLTHGPAMVQFHLEHTALRFIDGHQVPDFRGDAPGARTGGRSVCAAPFDARVLGADLKRLRAPLDILSFLGMGIGGGADLRHFLRVTRAFDSFSYVTRRLLRHFRDVLLHGRGTVLMGGNALAGALLKSALERGVKLFTGLAASELIRDQGRVTGAVLRSADGQTRSVRARRGVVLATGGFPHDVQRKKALFAHAPSGHEHWSAAPPTNTGDGLRLAEAVGARIDVGAHAGAWAPVSLVPRRDGSVGHFPHLVDRGKPGLIAVNARGQRFVNEAGSYHDFMNALFAGTPAGEAPVAWLVVDHRFQRRYGLGHSKPWPLPLGGHLRSGYLQRGHSFEELAQRCGIDPAGLARTVAHYNPAAREGRDPAFGRGSTAYNRMQGDAEHAGTNPCVAPIEDGPYYAVKVVPGSLGTFAGLAADAHARVLDARGAPIPGLYACGNDMASVMGGHYPSGGITLGPAMTFGYVLAHHVAGHALVTPPAPVDAGDTGPDSMARFTARAA